MNYLRYTCNLFALVILVCSSWGQNAKGVLTEQDINEVIAAYKNPERVAEFKRGMPPIASSQLRESVYQSLPLEFTANRVSDPESVKLLRTVLNPVLSFYGRAQVYDLIIVQNEIPLMMSDSGVVLLVTTGIIRNASSDDELLGYAAHEVAHEYFVYCSVGSRYILRTASKEEPALRRKLAEMLALIELQCDAFAALTLSYLKYNPLEFIKGLERTATTFPNIPMGNHPHHSIRRTVIEGITAEYITPRQSQAFKDLKKKLDL
jgi:hypothetical protein